MELPQNIHRLLSRTDITPRELYSLAAEYKIPSTLISTDCIYKNCSQYAHAELSLRCRQKPTSIISASSIIPIHGDFEDGNFRVFLTPYTLNNLLKYLNRWQTVSTRDFPNPFDFDFCERFLGCLQYMTEQDLYKIHAATFMPIVEASSSPIDLIRFYTLISSDESNFAVDFYYSSFSLTPVKVKSHYKFLSINITNK